MTLYKWKCLIKLFRVTLRRKKSEIIKTWCIIYLKWPIFLIYSFVVLSPQWSSDVGNVSPGDDRLPYIGRSEEGPLSTWRSWLRCPVDRKEKGVVFRGHRVFRESDITLQYLSKTINLGTVFIYLYWVYNHLLETHRTSWRTTSYNNVYITDQKPPE